MFRNQISLLMIIATYAVSLAKSQELPFYLSLSQISQSTSVGNDASIGLQSTASESNLAPFGTQNAVSSSNLSPSGTQNVVSSGNWAPFGPQNPSFSSSLLPSTGTPTNSQAAPTSNGDPTSAASYNILRRQLEYPNIELFAQNLFHLLQTSPSLEPFSEYAPYDLIYHVAVPVLARSGHADPNSLAELAAQSASTAGLLSSDLFYRAMSYTLADFLQYYGVLTQDLALKGPRDVLNLVEIYANTDWGKDAEAVVTAVVNGFYEYAGKVEGHDINVPFQLFSGLIQELASGATV